MSDDKDLTLLRNTADGHYAEALYYKAQQRSLEAISRALGPDKPREAIGKLRAALHAKEVQAWRSAMTFAGVLPPERRKRLRKAAYQRWIGPVSGGAFAGAKRYVAHHLDAADKVNPDHEGWPEDVEEAFRRQARAAFGIDEEGILD